MPFHSTHSCRKHAHLTMAAERTFIMIKPDGVQRGLIGEIISRFEKKGFKLVAMKVMQASVEHLEKHYADLSSKGFFRGLVTYMASGPVCAMVKQLNCHEWLNFMCVPQVPLSRFGRV